MAAIIQILNERLAGYGIRTRAVLEDGVLALLCEAQDAAVLEQSVLVPQIREILESLELRTLRRVKIASRLAAQDPHIIWLEEAAQNPERSLLWSEKITLRRPPFWPLRWGRDRDQTPKPDLSHLHTGQSAWPALPRNVVGIVSLCSLSFIAGWGYHQWRSRQPSEPPVVSVTTPVATASPAPTVTARPSPTTTPQTVVITPDTTAQIEPDDPFGSAVRLAEEAALAGQAAQTTAEWQKLAQKWQQASQLMGQVPADHEQYELAQDRKVRYQQNSQIAQPESAKR
jgi:hypothetical protein